MAIVARNLEGISAVLVSLSHGLASPEPQQVFSLFTGDIGKGARLLDDVALHVKVFTFPAMNLQIVFERTRIRFDATTPKKPDELRLGEIMAHVAKALYPDIPFQKIGFNYDIAYQYDVVIPQRQLWERFIAKDALEDMTHFGFQMSFQKEKGKRRDTYFCKVVSPLELRVLANIELDRALPTTEEAQKLYTQCYTECQEIVGKLAFS
jgi:hypothetical protein